MDNVTVKNPVHPGRIVRQHCLEPLALTVTAAWDLKRRSGSLLHRGACVTRAAYKYNSMCYSS